MPAINSRNIITAARGCACALLWLSAQPPALAITEASFIDKVLAQDKLLEEAQIGLDIKQIELDASRDNYADWRARLSAKAGYARRKDKQTHTSRSSGLLTTSPYVRDRKDAPRQIGLTVSKRFLSNPGHFSFGVSRSKYTTRNMRHDRDFSSRCGKPSQRASDKCELRQTYEDHQQYGGYRTAYYAQIGYPLLKHGGNAETLKTYHRNIYDLQDQKLSYLETKEDFLSQRLVDYLSWLRYHRQAQINNELLYALRQLQPANAAETASLNSLIAQTENYKRDAEIQQQAIAERLAILLDDAALITETPRFDLQKRVRLIDENTRDYLARHSRDLQRIDIDVKLNQLEIKYHTNRLLPSLDVTLRANKVYDAVGTVTTKYDDDTTDYRAGLEFSYPLGGSIITKTELAKRALSARRLQITYAERIESIEGNLQRLTRLLEWDEQRLLNATTAAAQSTRLQSEKYQQTSASIRDLLQAHRDERDAKLDHIDNLIDYQMRSIEYDNLLDRMITPLAG